MEWGSFKMSSAAIKTRKKAKVNRTLKNHSKKGVSFLKLAAKVTSKVVLLSRQQQEDMILEYRLKARSLAHSLLRRWHSRLDSQEVESLVDLSLCEAVRRFNKRNGASFITFLFYHLRGNLIRAIATAASLNYVPLPDFDGMDSSIERGGTSRGRIANAIEIADTFCHHDNQLPDAALLQKELAQLSSGACAKLDPLEKEVVYRIYVQEEQLLDIANSLGYSRCHISRVKRKAIEALYSDLSNSIYPDGDAPKLDFSDEDQPVVRKLHRRKAIHRRKPRSPKVQVESQEALVVNA